MASKSIVVSSTRSRPGGSLLRAALWVYLAPLVVIGVLLLVIFGLGLFATVLGVIVGALQRVEWH